MHLGGKCSCVSCCMCHGLDRDTLLASHPRRARQIGTYQPGTRCSRSLRSIWGGLGTERHQGLCTRKGPAKIVAPQRVWQADIANSGAAHPTRVVKPALLICQRICLRRPPAMGSTKTSTTSSSRLRLPRQIPWLCSCMCRDGCVFLVDVCVRLCFLLLCFCVFVRVLEWCVFI